MVGEEGCVATGPEEKGWDERVAQKARTEEEDGDRGKEGEGVEDLADPEAVGDGFGEDGDEGGGSDAGVAVGAEEVVVVREEVRTDDEEVVAEPDDGRRVRRRGG